MKGNEMKTWSDLCNNLNENFCGESLPEYISLDDMILVDEEGNQIVVKPNLSKGVVTDVINNLLKHIKRLEMEIKEKK
ncbi:MAG: hypothetical protein H8D23_20955 [Candidatus Brocadiales bacterium]|nr:hypothetical protein [Candidatus Brocadiales bacterium]